MDESKILEAIATLRSELGSRFDSIELKLNRTKKTVRKQQTQIDNLQEIVQAMQSAPKLRDNPTCLDKNGVYKLIEQLGYDPYTALRALLDGGYIRHGENGRRTVNQRINGEVKRVIVINM